jgi:hypothetical protein
VPAPDALVPLPADRGAYAVLVEAVRICLGDEHHLVIQAALNFVYVPTEHSSRVESSPVAALELVTV